MGNKSLNRNYADGFCENYAETVSFFSSCDKGGLYVNKYCNYFVVRFIGRMAIFKVEITKSFGDDYCGNSIKSVLS